MLDHFLQAAYEASEKTAAQKKTVELLMELPNEELYKIATGQSKLAFGENWIERFRGTPFMDQALQLAQEDLQIEMQADQDNAIRSTQGQQARVMKDQLDIRKKMLEIEAAKQESQANGGTPPPAIGAPPPAPPEQPPTTPSPMDGPPEAQGAGAVGGPPVAEGGAPGGKLASLRKHAFGAGATPTSIGAMATPAGVSNNISTAPTPPSAPSMGVKAAGDRMGMILAKHAAGVADAAKAVGAGSKILDFVKAHPKAVGALALGVPAAIQGYMEGEINPQTGMHEHSLSKAVGRGVMAGGIGAGLGHAANTIHNHYLAGTAKGLAGGEAFSGALKNTASDAVDAGGGYIDAIRNKWREHFPAKPANTNAVEEAVKAAAARFSSALSDLGMK